MEEVMEILKDVSLDWRQKRIKLEYAAENSLPHVRAGEKAMAYFESGVLNDLGDPGEGHRPFNPRYILPDYGRYLKQGSEFLNIAPPTDLYEAINAMMIIYNYVPSVSRIPVFLGRIDELLEPFADTVSEEERYRLLKNFLIYIDRVISNVWSHMNIGPRDTKIGRLILRIERELKNAVPNLSYLCDDTTPTEFNRLAVEAALEISKPYFVNDRLVSADLGSDYGVASCYNSLKLGGGSYTLIRLNLKEAAGLAKDLPDFLNRVLPELADAQCEIINTRIKFIVEEIRFFENSFLAREGLIGTDNFTAMAGEYGLFECVELLTGGLKMGTDQKADEAALKIIDHWVAEVNRHEGIYCGGTGGKIGIHAQSLIQSDRDLTAGVRIRVGSEPPLFDQIRLEGKLQKPFNTGVSDIYVFDKTAKTNPDGMLKIIKGAFQSGIKVMAIGCADSELIRVTGYLVKRSDIEKYRAGTQMREDTVGLSAESIVNYRLDQRRVWSLE